VGKGTQGARLSQALGVPSVSTGALLRALIATGESTPQVEQARQILGGGFVSDDFANELALAAIANQLGFVLDGYPRSLIQAQALGEFLAAQGTRLDHVLLFQLPDDALEERVAGRRFCAHCGATFHLRIAPPVRIGICDRCEGTLAVRPEDDQPEKRALRRALYQSQTAPLVAFYRVLGLLTEINAEGTPEQVYLKICESLPGLI
jgi:adenylate kinase